MNKEEILKQLKVHSPEQIPKLKRIIDLINHVNKHHEIQVTGFLSPDLKIYMERIFSHYPDIGYKLEGGFLDAEYNRLVIFPDYIYELEDTVAIIDLSYQEKYGVIGHRDVLGAVLGLGIKRDVIGDILVDTGHAQLMTTVDMAEYVLNQVSKIGRMTVSAKRVLQSDLIDYESEFVLIHATVKSLRLDAVLSKGFNISRSKACALIKAEQVKVNHNVVKQTSKEILEDALISARGHGRIRLEGLHGLSKKEREKITIKKYI